jgi:hypothetical protein
MAQTRPAQPGRDTGLIPAYAGRYSVFLAMENSTARYGGRGDPSIFSNVFEENAKVSGFSDWTVPPACRA